MDTDRQPAVVSPAFEPTGVIFSGSDVSRNNRRRFSLFVIVAIVVAVAIYGLFEWVIIPHQYASIGPKGREPEIAAYVIGVYRPLEIGALIGWGILATIFLVAWQLREVDRVSDTDFRNQIGQAEQSAAGEEVDQSVWRLARIRLDAYFGRNLQQINYIFILSVIVMLLGFIVMVVGVAYAIVHAGTSDATGALLPTAAGLITQFIGATFLFVYRSTIQQAIRYVQTLERMNTVGMAMAVLESINQSSDADLSDRTKAAIALALLANYGSEHDAVVKDMDEGRAETKKTGGATARRRLGQRSSESAPIVRSG